MNTRGFTFLASFILVAACGGQVEGASSSGGPHQGEGDTTGNSVPGESSVAANASSITVTTAVLGEPTQLGPNGGCSASQETITLNLQSGELTIVDCETGLYDAGAGNAPADQSEMTTRSQKTLDASQLADMKSLLASYVATSPPPKSECGYDGTAFALEVTSSAGTTTYWDEAYNCSYPPDGSWVTPMIRPLFNALDSL